MIKKTLIATAILLSSTVSSAYANNITLDNVTKDVTFLASDDLKGRASFSAEIDKAADYIADSFALSGLQPMQSTKGFKQTFSVYRIAPESSRLTLNGQVTTDDAIAVISSQASLNWNTQSDYTVYTIGAKDNFREKIAEVNNIGANSLVLVDPIHKQIYSRYHQYFNRGTTKLSLDNPNSLVMVLTKHSQIKSLKLEAKMAITEQSLTNVVGVLPGTTKPDEIVLYSAHYDHIGVNPANEGDKIYNGADDDASGTTAVMQLAKYFSDKKDNARTLMFVAFTAEEIGGFGSQYFSKQLNPDSVVAMINMEMIGKPSKFGAGTFWMTGFERSDLAAIMNKELSKTGEQVYQDPYPKQRLFYRSDNATLARLGVPAHSFSSTQLDKDEHYHKASDDISSLDLNSMTTVINSIAKGTKTLVDASATPTRVDVSKVNKSGAFF